MTQEEEERRRRVVTEEERRKQPGLPEETEDKGRGKKDLQEKLKLFNPPADPWASGGV